MKPHSFCIEEGKATAVSVQSFEWNGSPIQLFVVCPVLSKLLLICVVIQPVRFQEANTGAKCYSCEGFMRFSHEDFKSFTALREFKLLG